MMMTTTTTPNNDEYDDGVNNNNNNTVRPYDERNMKEAFIEAKKATSNGCMPFGAVLANTETGTILARAANIMPALSKRGGSFMTCDPTGHAEMTLLRSSDLRALSKEDRLNATLYSSTEPCVMCAGAIYWAGIGRVVYGCPAQLLEEQVSGPGGFDIPLQKLYGLARPGSRHIDVTGPLLCDEAIQLHKDSGVWEQYSTTQAANQDIAVEASLKTTGLGSADAKDDNIVPVIDLSNPNMEDVQKQLWDAATNVGFFSVIGHGIDQRKIDTAFEESANFFQQPLEDKKLQSPVDMSINCGFEYFAQVRPSTGVADQKESLQVTAREGGMDGRWPNPNFQQAATTLLEDSHRLANRILDLLQPLAVPAQASSSSADDYDPHLISKSHTLWAPDGQCTLRFLHYPPMDSTTTAKLLQDGYWRAGPHTDWDNVTLLYQRPGQGGLECCANPRTIQGKDAMYWTKVNPVEGAIAVNIGDMLARWSDGRLFSNLHRVRLPQDASKSRYSIAYFAQSDKKTWITSEKSPPITAGDYILSRINSNFSSAEEKKDG